MPESEQWVPISATPNVRVHISIRGREFPWLSKIVGAVLRPFLRRRAKERQRLWEPQLERIAQELAAELVGGRSNTDFHAKFADRVAAWLREHPELNR
jgi:hypothetical protein